jgi:hypothetical protein
MKTIPGYLTLTVDSATVERALIGAQTLCDGLYEGHLQWSIQGLLSQHKDRPEADNALAFVYDNYTTLQGATLLIGSVLSMINEAIIDGDVKFAQDYGFTMLGSDASKSTQDAV